MDTIGRFQDSIDWAISGSFTDQDIDEAKLSVFSQVTVKTYIEMLPIDSVS